MLLMTALLALASGVAPASAGDTAQTVQADAAHWKTTGEFSFTDVAGNRSLSLLTARAGFGRTGGGELDMTATIGVRYGRSSGDVAVEDFATGGELRFLPKGTISPFVNASGTRDDIRRIAVRVAVAAGADLNLVSETNRSVSVGVALLQDYEAHQGTDTTAASPATSLTRFNFRVTGKLPLRPGVSIVHRSTMEPVADDLGDYLLTSETGLRVQVAGSAAIQTTYRFNRDTSPPEGVQFRNDRTLTVGILIGA
jgi:putative salt-induced outer membrane protein YdiY